MSEEKGERISGNDLYAAIDLMLTGTDLMIRRGMLGGAKLCAERTQYLINLTEFDAKLAALNKDIRSMADRTDDQVFSNEDLSELLRPMAASIMLVSAGESQEDYNNICNHLIDALFKRVTVQ